ncbi:TetR family transcriptional regulator C-terminal domain-containing protein [Brevibacterium renqingii]|jgi:AcrR family transcriptional regulator|uniref:TetR family transcriptional regulator C-terminal domain-containing protein n=1 Tax=Brevibacterium renqingii TaxID=2776916 RepID=UPI001AE071E1|nr:TetR family transcriptional regulator C-terminal domain-containing protein [Brevibacterium renqingii]
MSSTPGHGSTPSRAKEAIVGTGLSQRQVAKAIGIDETKLSKALSGQRRFTADELLGLATSTGVTVRWLLGDESQVSAAPESLAPEAQNLTDVEGLTAAEATPRRHIVEVAWNLFSRHGYDSVRIADIAETAGVSSASVHYHFTNKSELFAATLDYSVKLAFDRQIAWLDGIDDPKHRLERLLELQSPIGQTAHREWSIWLQTWARLALEDGGSTEYPASYERWSRTVRSTIEDGQAEGLFRRGDSAAMADELTSLLDGLGVKVLTGVMDPGTFRIRLQTYLTRSIIRTQPEEESQ